MKKLIILIPVLIFLISCSSTQIQEDIAVRKCEYNLVPVTTREHSVSDITLNVIIAITNPNKEIDVNIQKFEGDLYANNRAISEIKFSDTKIPAKQTVPLAATITIPFEKMGKTLTGLVAMHSSEIKYHIEGEIVFDTSMGEVSLPIYAYEKRE